MRAIYLAASYLWLWRNPFQQAPCRTEVRTDSLLRAIPSPSQHDILAMISNVTDASLEYARQTPRDALTYRQVRKSYIDGYAERVTRCRKPTWYTLCGA
jgi:hypothetical protein